MSKLDDIAAKHNKEYTDALLKYATTRNLPMDVDLWPTDEQNSWFDESDAMLKAYDKAVEEYLKLPLDKRESEDWYMIDITLDTVDGPEYETIDIRTVSIDRLKNICQMFPRYNSYYFQKITDSL